MSRQRDSSLAVERRTRRTVLGSGAAALAAAGLGSGVGSADTTGQILTEAVIPEQTDIEQDVTGFWIHLAGEIDPQEAGVDDDCEYVSWEGDALAYDAQLIDKRAEPEQSQIALYLHENTDVSPGLLFIINNTHPCQSGYLGLELEQVGADLSGIRAREPATTTEDTGASGPGFDILGVLAALTGLGWLAGRDRSE